MAMNHVQFQAGMSLSAFLAQYGDERQCERALDAVGLHLFVPIRAEWNHLR